MLISILAFIVVLGVLIFVHELGHFITARMVGISVPRFSIGLGPKMVGFKRGETEYVISWIPLGGYVKMAGMEELEKLEGGPTEPRVSGTLTAGDTGIEVKPPPPPAPGDFESKSLPARTLVISAGVLMNLLFAVLVFAVSALLWGVRAIPEARVGSVTEEELPPGAEALARLPVGARITAVNGEAVDDFRDLNVAIGKADRTVRFEFAGLPDIVVSVPPGDTGRASLAAALEPVSQTEPVIDSVVDGQPAARAGLRPGDRVLSVNGAPVRLWQELVAALESSPGQPLQLQVQRGQDTLILSVTPEPRELHGQLTYGRVGMTALATPALPRERTGLAGALVYGVRECWNTVALTAEFLGGLFTGDASPRDVGGPIMIGQLSGRIARLGLENFLTFMALLSVNLAVLNLLPIPVLDGGHLMFLAAEAVRGRALSLEHRLRLTQVGFVIVLAIMVWALANDVLRLFGV